MKRHATTSSEVVFSGIGMLTSAGFGLEQNLEAMKIGRKPSSIEQYRLNKFQPAPFLSDKRMLKAVSAVDALGLVAVEGVKKDSKYDATTQNPQRVGIYVGANPASIFDTENYFQAMRDARKDDGKVCHGEFGKTFTSARPTTLLVGLPNNVLCYGAILLNAQGPNSNYTNLEISSHIALRKAADYISFGKLDFALAGGFTSHTDVVETACYRHRGYLNKDETNSTIMADGSIFTSLETRDAAEKRGAHILGTYIASEQSSLAAGFDSVAADPSALIYAISQTLSKSGIAPSEVGLVFGSGYGLKNVDQVELKALAEVFSQNEKPALATSSRVWGNLMEAGGIGEIALANWIYTTECGLIPQSMQIPADGYGTIVDIKKPYALILRSSPQGEYSCVLIRVEV